MGFLLTSYNSLPEQVEANKEKCKDLQNQIDNIDTHEIEEVKAQVQTNTQNIANVTQGLGVTNTALNAVTQDVDNLETDMTKKVDKSTQYTNSKNEISGDANSFDMRRTQGDAESLDETYVNHGVNVLSVGYKYSENGTILRKALATYDEDGINFYKTGDDFKVDNKVIITEENVGQYAPQTTLYEHNINFHIASSGTTYGHINVKITNKNNSVFTLTTLKQWLFDNGFTTKNKSYSAVGTAGYQSSSFQVISGVYVTSATSNLYITSQNPSTPNYEPSGNTIGYETSWTFTDTIREI